MLCGFCYSHRTLQKQPQTQPAHRGEALTQYSIVCKTRQLAPTGIWLKP